MKASQLVQRIEKLGGKFSIDGRTVTLDWPTSLTRKQQLLAARLDQEARRNGYLITSLVLEHAAVASWEASEACHCPARPFAHPAHKTANLRTALIESELLEKSASSKPRSSGPVSSQPELKPGRKRRTARKASTCATPGCLNSPAANAAGYCAHCQPSLFPVPPEATQ